MTPFVTPTRDAQRRNPVRTDLGDLQIECRPLPPAPKTFHILTGSCVLLFGIVVMLATAGRSGVVAFGLVMSGPIALLILIGIIRLVRGPRRQSEVYLYSRGIRAVTPAGERAMLLDDIEKVSFHVFKETKYFTTVASGQPLILHPREGDQLVIPVPLGGNPQGEEFERFDRIVDRLVILVQQRMLRSLRAGETVEWACDFKITPGGIQLPKGEHLPWSDIESCSLVEWSCAIKKRGRFLAYVLRAGYPNLLPGYRIAANYLARASGST
jgi:hypothetical protein